MKKRMLVICFDVPFPDNYGGVKDVWSRVKYLSSMGYELDLLASSSDDARVTKFHEENATTRRFRNICIVPRSFDWRAFLATGMPISMAIRSLPVGEEGDVKRILAERYDIVLVEHLKSLGLFAALRSVLKTKTTYFRSHNIESEYYRLLARSEPLGTKWLFLKVETLLYKWLERRLATSNWFERVLYISRSDMGQDKSFQMSEKMWLPMCTGPIVSAGRSEFDARSNTILYAGNLDSSDNVKSVWQVCRTIEPLLRSGEIEFTVVGKRSLGVGMSLPEMSGVSYRFNVSTEDLQAAYRAARLFFVYSLNEAGVKTKLIEAMMHEVPVVANAAGVKGSGFENVVYQVEAAERGKGGDLGFLRELVLSKEAWERYRDRQKKGVETFVAEVEKSYRLVFAA